MPLPDRTDRYPIVVYAATAPGTPLAHVITSDRVTNANLYDMMEICYDFGQSFYLINTAEYIVQRDDEAVEAGRGYIVTEGGLAC